MPAIYLFTSISSLADHPDTPKAQALYITLIDKRDQYKQIQREYLTEFNKIVAEFQIEITAHHTEKLRQKQHNTEEKSREAEDKAAQNIINSLKQN